MLNASTNRSAEMTASIPAPPPISGKRRVVRLPQGLVIPPSNFPRSRKHRRMLFRMQLQNQATAPRGPGGLTTSH